MSNGQIKLWFNGKTNEPVTIVDKVQGGYLVKLENGMTVGPIIASPSTLR